MATIQKMSLEDIQGITDMKKGHASKIMAAINDQRWYVWYALNDNCIGMYMYPKVVDRCRQTVSKDFLI